MIIICLVIDNSVFVSIKLYTGCMYNIICMEVDTLSHGTENGSGTNTNGISAASTGNRIEVLPELEKLTDEILKDAERADFGSNAVPADEPQKPVKKSVSRVKRTVVTLLLLALSAGIIFAAVRIINVMNIFNSINYVSPTQQTSATELLVDRSYVQQHVSHSDQTKNILLIGYDVDAEGLSRSDSMIILSLDHTHKKIKLTSLMRDMYVTIPDKGEHKLNAAYFYGGAELLTDTIYANLGLDIDKYVCVDYSMFAEIVDYIGGVQIHIMEAELGQFNKHVYGRQNRIKAEGTYNMNGQQVLAYCRIRKAVGTDTVRTARQRKVLDKIIEKCRHMQFYQLEELTAKIAPGVTTNFTQSEMMTMLAEGFVSMDYQTSQMRIPVDGTWHGKYINKIWYMTFDLNQNAQYLNDFIYGDDKISETLASQLKENDDAVRQEYLQQ